MFFCCGGVEGQVQCTVAFEEQDTLELHMFCLDLGTQHDSHEINATNKALQVPRQLFLLMGLQCWELGFPAVRFAFPWMLDDP